MFSIRIPLRDPRSKTALFLRVGGHLALRGVDVLLVGKGLLERTVKSGGLRLTDVERDATGFDESLQLPGHPHLTAKFDLEALKSDDFLAVFVCLKLGDNDLAASLGTLKKDTVIISMQNGIDNKKKLAKLLPEHPIVGGVVPYGVIEAAPGHLRRATFGPLVFDDGMPAPLTAALRGAGLAVEVLSEADTHAEQCFKLVVNCQNALNALRGCPLVEAAQDRPKAQCLYRELMASAWEEATEVLRRSGQPLRGTINGMPMDRYIQILRLPNFALNAVKRVKSGLAPDPGYHSSMFYDLEQRRRTEIEEMTDLWFLGFGPPSGGAQRGSCARSRAKADQSLRALLPAALCHVMLVAPSRSFAPCVV
eukprot:s1053_g2.t1